MKDIGDYTMVTTETIWAGYTTVRVLSTAGSNSVFGRLVNAVSGLSDAAKAFLEASAPPLYFLLFLLFCAGFSLSIYLPFIPFIFWMTGIGNWIVSVLIGCAAGPCGPPPIWEQVRTGKPGRLRLHLPDRQHDQTAADGIRVLFCIGRHRGGGTVLNALFAAALMNVQINSVTGVFSMAGFLMIYARACTTLVAAILHFRLICLTM